jgi:hypothetical protein
MRRTWTGGEHRWAAKKGDIPWKSMAAVFPKDDPYFAQARPALRGGGRGWRAPGCGLCLPARFSALAVAPAASRGNASDTRLLRLPSRTTQEPQPSQPNSMQVVVNMARLMREGPPALRRAARAPAPALAAAAAAPAPAAAAQRTASPAPSGSTAATAAAGRASSSRPGSARSAAADPPPSDSGASDGGSGGGDADADPEPAEDDPPAGAGGATPFLGDADTDEALIAAAAAEQVRTLGRSAGVVSAN